MRSILSLFRPNAEPESDAPMDARSKLREAMQAVIQAQLVLDERRQATERVQAMVAAADEADSALQAAEAAAIEANRQWAEAGAVGDLPPEALQLIEAAEVARKNAYAARLKAQGAAGALSGARWDGDANRLRDTGTLASETEAEDALTRARLALGTATRDVLHNEAAPLIERAQEAHAELISLIDSLAGLAFLQRHSPSRHPFAGQGGINMQKILADLTVSTRFSEDELREMMEPWVSFGKALLHDPAAVSEILAVRR